MSRRRVLGTASATAGSGFLSGAMGIGGGLLNVPLLVYVLGRKTRKAIGTSSLLIIPTAAVGFAAYLAGLAFRPSGFGWPEAYGLIPTIMPITGGRSRASRPWFTRNPRPTVAKITSAPMSDRQAKDQPIFAAEIR